MPENYYPTGDEEGLEQPAGETPEMESETEEVEDEGESELATALIPKSVLSVGSFEPGQEVTFKIVKVYGDEVEVAPVASKEPTETEEESPMSADEEIDMMAMEGA